MMMKHCYTLVLCLLLLAVVKEGYGQACITPQRIYADHQSHGNSAVLVASSSVEDPDNAVGVNSANNNYAVLNVGTLLGSAEAWIELKFTNVSNPTLPLPGGTTTYVKIGGNSVVNLLNLIGGSSLPVSVYNGATTTVLGTPIVSTNVSVTNLIGSDNSIYLAITSSVPYNAVRIALNASVIIGSGELFVYHAFYQTAGISCDPALGTSTSISGLLTLGGAITDPNKAIDNNLSTNALFSMGVAGVGTTLKETVYFPGPSNSGDAATITFSIPPSLLLDLSLLNNIQMTPYYGSTAGTPISLASLLSIDLLTLLRENNIVTVSLVPAQTFDRIEISMSSLVSVLGQMNLYEVQRTPPKPTFSSPAAQNITICAGQEATLTAMVGSCDELHWYSTATGGTATIGANYLTETLNTTKTYYVAAARIGCTAESERVPITVTVNPLPTISSIVASTTNLCVGVGVTYTNASTEPGVWSTSDPAVATVNSVGFVKGVSVGTAVITYKVTNNITGCSNSTSKTVTVYPLPTISLNPIASVCSGITNTSLSYNATSGGPLKYSIEWDTPGFSNVTDVDLPTSPISLVIPEDASIGDHTGTFILRNTASGCINSYLIAITITPKPPTPHVIISNTSQY